MLNMAADEFSSHGCNDYELPNTPENLKFVQDMEVALSAPEDRYILLSDDESEIYVMDWMLMRYCAKLLEEEANQ